MLFGKYCIYDNATNRIVDKDFSTFRDAQDVLEALELMDRKSGRYVPNRLEVRQYREAKVKPIKFDEADLYSPQDC